MKKKACAMVVALMVLFASLGSGLCNTQTKESRPGDYLEGGVDNP